jgi:hypothetical protein
MPSPARKQGERTAIAAAAKLCQARALPPLHHCRLQLATSFRLAVLYHLPPPAPPFRARLGEKTRRRHGLVRQSAVEFWLVVASVSPAISLSSR